MPYTRLRYHIVIATKGRAPWITPDIENFLYPVIGHITKNIDCRLLEIGGIEDHIHLLPALRPSIAVSDFISILKSNSTGAIKRNFPWMNHFRWQGTFSAFTIGPNDLQRITYYIQNQKEHHNRGTLITRLEPIDDPPQSGE
jgi:REP element-mobilizing transposase RayT